MHVHKSTTLLFQNYLEYITYTVLTGNLVELSRCLSLKLVVMAGRRRNNKPSSAKSGRSKTLGAVHCYFQIYFSIFVVVPGEIPMCVDVTWGTVRPFGFRCYDPTQVGL